MSSGPEVVIIGGGLIGLSTAYQVMSLEPAARVTVLERTAVGVAASGASAAGVRVMGRDRAERALALRSLARWPELDRDLEAPTGYRRSGGVRVILDEADWPVAEAAVDEQRASGVPVELVDAAAARALAPGLAPGCLGGVYCAIDGQADATSVVRAFATAARRLGARVDEGVTVVGLLEETGRVRGVTRSDGAEQRCDIVLVAAGAWTAALVASCGVPLPLQARALQMLLTEPAPPALTPVLGCFGRVLSLKQLADGRHLIGGGWPADIVDEIGNRWQLREDSIQGNLAVARTVYPPLAEVALAYGWAGIEAFTPDELPLLGPVAGIEGLFVAAGFSGHGFALAPAIGEILACLALGQAAHDDVWAGLRVDRIASPTSQPAAG